MEREAVVSYLASLTAEERENVVGEAVHRAHPWHLRRYAGGVICARLVGATYHLANTDDLAKADALYAKVGWHGDACWVETVTQKTDQSNNQEQNSGS